MRLRIVHAHVRGGTCKYWVMTCNVAHWIWQKFFSRLCHNVDIHSPIPCKQKHPRPPFSREQIIGRAPSLITFDSPTVSGKACVCLAASVAGKARTLLVRLRGIDELHLDRPELYGALIKNNHAWQGIDPEGGGLERPQVEDHPRGRLIPRGVAVESRRGPPIASGARVSSLRIVQGTGDLAPIADQCSWPTSRVDSTVRPSKFRAAGAWINFLKSVEKM